MEIKKLITGFLVLACAASASALVLSGVSGTPSTATADTTPTITAATGTPDSTFGANAFLPDVIQPVASDSVAAAGAPAFQNDPNNLTDALANSFLNGVASANPNGPIDDGTGNATMATPDVQVVANLVASSTAMQDLKTPDWNLEAASQPIRTSADNSPASISQYSAALTDIVNKHFVATGVMATINSANPDASQAGYVQSQVQSVLGDALALQTPTQLLDFQKSMVKVLVYEKNELGTLQNVNTDPVRTSLVIQNEEDSYRAALTDLQTQLQKASALQGFSFGSAPVHSESRATAFINKLFGIKTANAQYLTFDAGNFGEWLLKFVKDVVLQILKNTVMALIQKKVLAWVQGNGAPRFIQQWGTTLINAYAQSALGAIDAQMSCVPQFYAPKMKLTLGGFYRPAGNNVCANQFQASLGGNTFQQFQNNFQNGGFVAFGSSMLPSGNYYGGLFFNAQVVENTANNAKTAAQSKAVANQGQTGDQTCPDGQNPNGTHWVCVDPADGSQFNIDQNEIGPQCIAKGFSPSIQQNNGKCEDPNGNWTGEPTVTTPGLFTGFGVSSALDANPKLIAAANDIVGLLNAFLGSLMNTLANVAINAAANGVNAGLAGGVNQGQITGGGVNTIQPVPLSCNPPTQNVPVGTTATIGAVGGKTDANNNPPTYTWNASNGVLQTGIMFSNTFPIAGIFTVTVTDSTGDPPATCRVVVQ